MREYSRGSIQQTVAWNVLTALLALEAIAGLVIAWSVVQAFLGANDEPLAQRLSVLLSALIALAWVIITFWGARRSRAGWVRGSAMTMHVLMFAGGTGVLQGIIGTPALGWGLVVCAFIGFFSAVVARPSVPTTPADSAGPSGT